MPMKSTTNKAKMRLPTTASVKLKKRRKDSSSDHQDSEPDTTVTSNVSQSSTIRNPDTIQSTMNKTRSAPSQCRKILKLISPLMEKVQRPGVNVDETLNGMERIYDENDEKDFSEVLWRIMVIPFHIPKGNEKTDRIAQFFYRVITTIGTNSEKLGTCLYFRILRLCIKYHRDKRIPVRYRIAETIVKIMQWTVIVNILPKEVQEQLLEVFSERIKDKHHSVRALSATGLGFLQFPPENTKVICKISYALVSALSSDPNSEVRKAAVKSLLIDRSTIEYLVHKVMDKNDVVKIAALSIIAEKIPIRTFTISQRECILQSSLKNVPDGVKKQGMLVLKKWQESCQGDLCGLLRKLDVIENEKLCYLILDTLYPESNSECYEKIDKSFIVGKLIPLENLTTERTFIWLFMFRKFGNDPYYREKLMPASNDIFTYINSYLEQPVTEDSDTGKEKLHFTLKHILCILKFLQLEEGGRNEMKRLVSRVFLSDHLSIIHVKILVQLLHMCYLEEKDEGVMNIINKVLERSACSPAPAETSPAVVEDVEKVVMELKIELANIMHSRHKRKRDLDEAVCKNEFALAQVCQDEIKELLIQEESIKNKITSCIDPNRKSLEENSEDEEQETETNYSTQALCVVLTAIIAHVQITQTISIQARHFYEHRVANEMHKFDEPRLRQQTLKLMTLVGFQNFEDAEKSMIFCIQGVLRDEPRVQVQALQCIFDLVLQYSFEEFEVLPKIMKVLTGNTDSPSEDEENLSPLRFLSLSFLMSMDTALLTTSVEGVIKLLLSNKLHSPKVIKTLLLIWANPANLQTKIYRDVQRWLPIYANTGLTQGYLIANALVPCMQKILTSRPTSPLSDASIDSFAAFVLQNTNQEVMQTVSWAHKIHQTVAINVLKEMKFHSSSTTSIIFARIIKQLELQNCDFTSLCQMIKLCKPLSYDTNRHVRTIILDFIQYLKSLGGTFEDNESNMDSDSTFPSKSQTVRTGVDSDDSLNVNEVFSSSEEEESRDDTVVTRSPVSARLSQQSSRSTMSLRSLRTTSSQRSVLSPIVSDDGSPSESDSSDGSIYGPTPPV